MVLKILSHFKMLQHMQVKKRYCIIFLSFLLTTTVAAQDEKINGNIALQMSSNDSMYVVTATVTNITTQQPAKDVELTLYVQRTFGLMKVADGTTDSMGTIIAEFPSDIQGRHDGSGPMRCRRGWQNQRAPLCQLPDCCG